MTSSNTPSFRTRLAAGAIAFAVVSGGALLTSAPAFAETTAPTESPADTTTPTESTAAVVIAPTLAATPAALTPEEAAAGTSILLQAAGFDHEGPGVTVSVAGDPTPLATELAVAADGTVNYTAIPKLIGGEEGAELPEGTFTFTFTQGEGDDALTASADVTIAKATETPAPTEPEDADDAALDPTSAPTQAVFLPSDVVTYNLANFTPGATITISIAGPVEGSFDDTVLEDGTFPGEITYHEYDPATEADLGQVDFPVGSYTVTIVEAESGLTTSFAFDVATGDQVPADGGNEGEAHDGASNEGANTANGDDQLATTGADDVFGIAGLGLLVAGVGTAALVLSRRFAGKRAE